MTHILYFADYLSEAVGVHNGKERAKVAPRQINAGDIMQNMFLYERCDGTNGILHPTTMVVIKTETIREDKHYVSTLPRATFHGKARLLNPAAPATSRTVDKLFYDEFGRCYTHVLINETASMRKTHVGIIRADENTPAFIKVTLKAIRETENMHPVYVSPNSPFIVMVETE